MSYGTDAFSAPTPLQVSACWILLGVQRPDKGQQKDIGWIKKKESLVWKNCNLFILFFQIVWYQNKIYGKSFFAFYGNLNFSDGEKLKDECRNWINPDIIINHSWGANLQETV